MAEGADQEPSASRATTMPEPNRPEPMKPAFRTVRTARPYVTSLVSVRPCLPRAVLDAHLRPGQYLRWNDLIGTESLPRVYKGGQNLGGFLAFTYFPRWIVSRTSRDEYMRGSGQGRRERYSTYCLKMPAEGYESQEASWRWVSR